MCEHVHAHAARHVMDKGPFHGTGAVLTNLTSLSITDGSLRRIIAAHYIDRHCAADTRGRNTHIQRPVEPVALSRACAATAGMHPVQADGLVPDGNS